jgi:hypothetical protein
VWLGLDMNADEYLKLYRKFDPSGNKKISYYEWNNIVGNLIHPLSDIKLSRPDTPKMKEWTRRALQRGLKEQVVDPIKAFREIDSDLSGYISHQEFVQLLRKLGVSITGDDPRNDEESFYVFKKYQNKTKNPTGQLKEEEFLALYEDFAHRAFRSQPKRCAFSERHLKTHYPSSTRRTIRPKSFVHRVHDATLA